MDPNVVVTHTKVDDIVSIEGNEYETWTTLGLTPFEDFYVKLEFKNLKQEDLSLLASLWKVHKALSFRSKLVEKESFNITHILVEKFQTNNLLDMTWECLSDDPGFSLILDL